jgi:hypothetical protein
MGGWRIRTNIRRDPSDDDLFLPRGFDSGAEVGVVPGVDFALTLDEGRVRVHFQDLLGERAVGTWGSIRARLADSELNIYTPV